MELNASQQRNRKKLNYMCLSLWDAHAKMDAKLQERIEPGTNILYIYSENDLGFMQMK